MFSSFVIHVVDITSPHIANNIATVNNELVELDSLHKPTIVFFNKSDILHDKEIEKYVRAHYPEAIIGSVFSGEGLDLLRERMLDLYDGMML